MHLIAGLGNPGADYANTRHNIGFWAVDEIIRRFSLVGPKSKFKSEVYEGRIGGDKVLVLKPQTFMNASGEAIGEAMRFYKLAPGDVTVLYDELDLAPLKVKARTGGGAAGHNGIRSTIQHIGPDFHRVRIGIGHPGSKDRVSGFVLSAFSKSETPDFEDLANDIAHGAQWLVAGDHSRFMTELALRRNPAPARVKTDTKQNPAAAGGGGKTDPKSPATPEASGPFGALQALKAKLTNKDTD